MNEIIYEVNGPLTADEFIHVLHASTLAERRPVDDLECIQGMIDHADLTISARYGSKLIGIARSVTDFNYCCYLSDICVDLEFQHQGIGKELIRRTKEQIGLKCKLILLTAPAAEQYYPKIGFTKLDNAWLLDEGQNVQ